MGKASVNRTEITNDWDTKLEQLMKMYCEIKSAGYSLMPDVGEEEKKMLSRLMEMMNKQLDNWDGNK